MPNTIDATTTAGRPCWLELHTPDAEAAAAFYRALLGWQVTAAEPGSGIATEVRHRDHLIASFEAAQDRSGWEVCLLVDDVEACVAAAKETGGVLVPATAVDQTMSFAVVTDPGGVSVGAMSSTEPMPPTPLEAGFPLWYELLTDEFEASTAFYESAFGWRTRELVPGMAYRVNDPGTGPLSGIGDLSSLGGNAPGWRVYFGVEDADGAAARVSALGGQVLAEPMDSPYGRIAPVCDPLGARFMLVEAG